MRSVASAAETRQVTELPDPLVAPTRHRFALCQSRFSVQDRPTNKNKREEAMRGVVFNGERELQLMQFPDPTPDAHDVVIEMKASGMCGSDLHQYRRPKGQAQATGIPVNDGPVIAGHETCGVVGAVGASVDARAAGVGHG